jgi:hypothetical protein
MILDEKLIEEKIANQKETYEKKQKLPLLLKKEKVMLFHCMSCLI